VHDTGIEDALVVTPDGVRRANVYVTDGLITAIGDEPLPARERIAAGGRPLLPGMVDTHVHLMDPGDPTREDFPSGTAAAAVNGVTTVLEHTHVQPVRTTEDLRAKCEHLADRSWVDYGLVAHAWPGGVDELEPLWQAGIAYFKLFTCETHGIAAHDAPSLREHFETVARIGAVCLVHCEDNALCAVDECRLRATDRDDGEIISEWRSPMAERVAVAGTLQVAHLTGARVGVAHCSSPAVADLISHTRSAGADVVAEACPQYFLLRASELAEHGALRKFTPPARARTDADEEQMWRLLRGGELAFVSSDHAPSTREQKAQGIWDAPFGLPGLDTTMALLLDASARHRLSLSDVARVYSEAPARQYGLWPRKGALAVGADADLILIDLDAERVLTDERVRSKAGWTPYAGRRVRGRVLTTWLRGEVIARDGELVGGRRGRFVPGAGASS